MMTSEEGWVEENPEDWWDALVSTVREIGARFPLGSVRAIGISCTNALLAVDRAGHPLLPAIMLWDQRALEQSEHLRSFAGLIRETTHNRVVPGNFAAPSMQWIKKHRPDVFAATFKFLVPTGFVVHRLTGAFSIDPSRASTTLLFDLAGGSWSESLCDIVSVPVDMLPPVVPSDSVVGTLSHHIAQMLHLPPETLVVAGCTDTAAAGLGLGAAFPGSAFLVMGTAARLTGVMGQPPRDDRLLNTCHCVPGRWLAIAAMNGAGSSLRWFKETFGLSIPEDANGNSYDRLMEEAETAPGGSMGLIYLPYLAAERSPIWNPLARGVFFGLTLRHGRAEIIRSILEGVAFAIRQNLQILEAELGHSIEALPIGGGGAKGRLWCQIIADVLGQLLLRPKFVDVEASGAAQLAAKGAGFLPANSSSGKEWIKGEMELITPSKKREVYSKLFEVYNGLSRDVSPWFRPLAGL